LTVVEELVVEIRGDIEDLKKDLKEAEKETGNFAASIGGIAKGIGAGLAVAAGAAAAIGVAGVNAAKDFESAWTGVEQGVNGTADELAALKTVVDGMSNSLPFSREELSGLAATLGDAKVAAADMEAPLRAAADWAAATGKSAEDAGQQIQEFIRKTQAAPGAVAGLLNAAVATGGAMGAMDTGILDFTTKLAPFGQRLGLTTDEVIAFGGAFLGAGGDAEKGGVAIGQLLSALAVASGDAEAAAAGASAAAAAIVQAKAALDSAMEAGDAKGIKEAEAALKDAQKAMEALGDGAAQLEILASVAGVTGAEFQRVFAEDAAGAMAMFLSGLQGLDGTSAIGVLDQLGLGGQKTAESILTLASAADKLPEAFAVSAEALSNTEALAAKAALRYDDFASKLQTFKNQVQGVMIEVGSALLPVAGQILDAVAPALATLGPALAGMAEPVAQAFADLVPFLQDALAVLLPIFQDAFKSIGPILAGIVKAVGPILAALGPAISAILGSVMRVFEGLLPVIEALAPLVAEFAGVLAEVLAGVLPALVPLIVALGGALGEVLVEVLRLVTPLLIILAPVLGAIAQALTPIIGAVIDVASWMLRWQLGSLEPLIDAVSRFFAWLGPVKSALLFLLPPVAFLAGAFGGLRDVVGWAQEKVENFVKGVKALRDVLSDVDIVGSILGALKTFGRAFADFFGGLVEDAVQWGKDIIAGFLDGLKAAWGAVESWLKDKWESVKGTVRSIFDIRSPSGVFRGYGEDIVEGFRLGLSGLQDTLNVSVEPISRDLQRPVPAFLGGEPPAATATQPATVGGDTFTIGTILFQPVMPQGATEADQDRIFQGFLERLRTERFRR
jgi:phage-related protein